MTVYILTTEAEADMRGIIRYTRKEWSAVQVRRYIAKLEKGIANLAAGQGSFKDMITGADVIEAACRTRSRR